MFVRLLLAAAIIAVTVAIQAVFMSTGLRIFRRMEMEKPGFLSGHATITVVVWVTYLLIPIILDVCLWASFFAMFGILPSFEDAAYFSTVTFTTVGYGDIVLGKEWRQIAVFEAVNGWIIFGWATALMMAVIQRLYFRADNGF
jgi:voltage-gated potassium channel Kch